MQHNNLHAWANSTAEVRDALKRDYERDHKRLTWADVAVGAGLGWLVRSWAWPDIVAAYVVVLGAVSSLRLFIDQSNRNWWLHRVNWDSAVREEADEEAYRRQSMADQDREQPDDWEMS